MAAIAHHNLIRWSLAALLAWVWPALAVDANCAGLCPVRSAQVVRALHVGDCSASASGAQAPSAACGERCDCCEAGVGCAVPPTDASAPAAASCRCDDDRAPVGQQAPRATVPTPKWSPAADLPVWGRVAIRPAVSLVAPLLGEISPPGNCRPHLLYRVILC